MQKITTFLMFSGERHGKAEEAINFYVARFQNSCVDSIEWYEPGEKSTRRRHIGTGHEK